MYVYTHTHTQTHILVHLQTSLLTSISPSDKMLFFFRLQFPYFIFISIKLGTNVKSINQSHSNTLLLLRAAGQVTMSEAK